MRARCPEWPPAFNTSHKALQEIRAFVGRRAAVTLGGLDHLPRAYVHQWLVGAIVYLVTIADATGVEGVVEDVSDGEVAELVACASLEASRVEPRRDFTPTMISRISILPPSATATVMSTFWRTSLHIVKR